MADSNISVLQRVRLRDVQAVAPAIYRSLYPDEAVFQRAGPPAAIRRMPGEIHAMISINSTIEAAGKG